jgi:hypothetical protein
MSSLRSEKDREAADRLRAVTGQEEAFEATLTTNDRVIARVTDGIYRQPGSALRELIANAYDADATWVSIKTDAPRFSRISIEDNGTGMTPDAVIHLLHNIGGSAKRTEQGQELGIASLTDASTSPNGRQLIGKLGIGIFSVSQLTHSFQIVTKTAGDFYRTVVLVNLRQFSDESTNGDEAEFKAGTYQIWRELTDDLNGHGTTVVLTSIRPQTRESLQSQQLWNAVDHPSSDDAGAKSLSIVPKFHIGRLEDAELLREGQGKSIRNLPWDDRDEPDVAFRKMVDSVWAAVRGRASVKLADMFDAYLQMMWNLALALPLPYVEGSLLDEKVDDGWAYFYKLSNSTKGSAEPLEADKPDLTVRELAGLPPGGSGYQDFRVLINGVRLLRPLKFRNLPTTQHALKKPMVFLGSLREEFRGFDRDVSAGPLEFDAYLFWTPKVAPTEHQGVLIRIHGASGTLFDSTFFSYQVSEQTRLRQITCEIFVREGLEAALNIDRESFNTSHPHTVVLTRWVHSALRQLATAQKREAERIRIASRAGAQQRTESRISRIIESANDLRTDGEGVVPNIRFTSAADKAQPSSEGEITQSYSLETLVQEIPDSPAIVPSKANLDKLEAITKVLSVYGVLDQLSPKEQGNLLGSILGILEAESLG